MYEGGNDTTFEKVNGITAPSTWNNRVPYIGTEEKIFYDVNTQFQFVFVKEKPEDDYSDYSAVILGADESAVDDDGVLTIPDALDAYYLYPDEGTAVSYCAVNRSGEYLFYKDNSGIDPVFKENLHGGKGED